MIFIKGHRFESNIVELLKGGGGGGGGEEARRCPSIFIYDLAWARFLDAFYESLCNYALKSSLLHVRSGVDKKIASKICFYGF